FALVFFYMIPIAFVQSLANLQGLDRVAPFLRPVTRLDFSSSEVLYFMLVNVFLGSIIAGTAFSSLTLSFPVTTRFRIIPGDAMAKDKVEEEDRTGVEHEKHLADARLVPVTELGTPSHYQQHEVYNPPSPSSHYASAMSSPLSYEYHTKLIGMRKHGGYRYNN
ncbi:hypothetical protein HID58_018864, partial [Brassica napus]